MKNIVFVILLLIFSCSNLFASTYGVIVGQVGNVYYTGIAVGETKYQNQAIAFLCNEYIKKYFSSFNGNVYLELKFSDNKQDKLSYDLFQGKQWENAEENRPVKGKGIRIQYFQSVNRSKNVLKLLEYALQNLNRINHDGISELAISKILNEDASRKINTILDLKVNRNLEKSYTEYYLQNDKYYFTDYFNKDSVYLELDRIYQIISEYYLGTIIFDTDSTGYFYNRNTRKLSEKFVIQDKMSSFYYIHTSSDNNKKRIYFEYEPNTYMWEEPKRKFVYLADQLYLIQNFEQYEDILIEQIQNKQ